MDFLYITLANIIWIFYSMSEGVREAFFDHYKNSNKRNCNYNIKFIFSLQRLIILLLITSIMFKIFGPLAILISIGQICIFKYFHKFLYDTSVKKLKNNYIEENNQEFSIFKNMNKYKTILLLIGISLQIFAYMFII